jgi:hypothetical protein
VHNILKWVPTEVHTFNEVNFGTCFLFINCSVLTNILELCQSFLLTGVVTDWHVYKFNSHYRFLTRRMRWAGHVARMGEKRHVYRILVGKPEGKRPLGRPRRRWVDNIKMDLTEIG